MRLAPTTPTHCSSCFDQKVGERHVDFEVAFDGPVVENARDGMDPVAIDELVVCEKCLADAVALLPVERDQEEVDEIEALRARVAELEQANGDLGEYNDKLLDAIQAREAGEKAKGAAEPVES